MRKTEFDISAAAVLLIAALWYFDGSGLFSAAAPAIAAHELGHWLAVRLTGGRVTRLRISLCGAYMGCTPSYSPACGVLRSLAGPAAGLMFALAAATAGRLLGSLYLNCSAGISVLLSLFNLLPHPELDGGRALTEALGAELVDSLGLISSAALVVFGLGLRARGFGYAMSLAGIMLLLMSLSSRRDR